MIDTAPPKVGLSEEDILELAQMYDEAGFDNDPPPSWYVERYGQQLLRPSGSPDTAQPRYDERGKVDPYNQTPNDNLLLRTTGAPLRFRTKDLKETHKYGCLMLMLPDDVRKQITDWVLEEVPDFHLGKGGREFSSHVTLVYGFEDAPDLVDDLRTILQRWGPYTIRLAPTLSLFESGYGKWKNEDGDVLKVAVESPRLHEMHDVLKTLFDCPGDTHPTFQPHVTLAYLNEMLGVSGSYEVLCAPFLSREVRIDEAEYSAADGTKARFRLGMLPSLGNKGLPDDLIPTVDGYCEREGTGRNLYWNAKEKKVWWETFDDDDPDKTAELVDDLKKVRGVSSVKVVPESGPKGEGWQHVWPPDDNKMLGVKPHAVNKVLAWDDAMSDGGGHGQFICACGRVIRQCRCRATADRPQRIYHVTDRFCRDCSNRSKALEAPKVTPTTTERPPEPAAEAQREPPQHEQPPPARRTPTNAAVQNPKVAPPPTRVPSEPAVEQPESPVAHLPEEETQQAGPRPAPEAPVRPNVALSRPPRTPKYKLTRGEQGELKGHALRHLSGREYGLYQTGTEAQEAARQLSKKEHDYSPVEIYGDPEHPTQEVPQDVQDAELTSSEGQQVDTIRHEVYATLSANTDTLPGLAKLNEAANRGDLQASRILSDVARDSLSYLTKGVGSAKISYIPVTGQYGGSREASLGLQMEFDAADRKYILAALAKFGQNFNQEQVHVRGAVEKGTHVGHDYGDGSYNTVSYKIGLKQPLSSEEATRVIQESGLYGLTIANDHVEAYYVGNPTDAQTIAAFQQGIRRAHESLGANGTGIEQATSRLWVYGHGGGAIPYAEIQGDLHTGAPTDNATARRVAARLAGRNVSGVEAAKKMTPEQAQLHTEIAKAYGGMRTNALNDPVVRRAYQELSQEVKEQYEALPIKVEILSGQGEPYKSSADMRRDVLENNHLYIYGTDPNTFGPEGVIYDNYPLLEPSGLKDSNGIPLLANDLLRAVHDYYAHTMTGVQFGPLGEEAAWRNHMLMTRSPLARWALTSETRGQNSWVNFGPHGEQNRTNPKNTVFAEQKVDLLPVEYALMGDKELDDELLRAANSGQKAMSWQGSGSGGDLVAPPEFRGVPPRKPRPSLFDKSMVAPNFKSRGMPCKKGENARFGCIPAKKPEPKPRQTQQAKPDEIEAEMTPTEVRTRQTPRVSERLSTTSSGPETVALESDSPHKKLLRNLPIKHRQPLQAGGINAGKELWTLSDGSKAVYKPAAGEPQARPSIPAGTLYLREAAASALADILGFGDLVPPTVVRDGGSVQLFASGATLALNAPPDKDFGDSPEDAARATVFNYIMGVGDRHHGNWLLKHGKIVLIDNGLSLPTKRNISDYAEVEFFLHAAEAQLPMPDVSGMKGKWPKVEKAFSDLGIEPAATALAKERYDVVMSGRHAKVADLPNPVNPSTPRTLGQFARLVEMLADEQRGANPDKTGEQK